ncbi:DUF2459 domain-containing protein [Sulfitobacter albidus]|uniref:DUF2459 domain-containing protein n=1 Tax=Sulfitobacter albidus TaxID=2829501 RepID=A0A975JDD3_9RHOB|nr:DUF2459 domain-containing protein [Sulfitobacter albidus]QUJ76363.1 DUF2459 domain-containing protein [Sulfitobacter albidus]
MTVGTVVRSVVGDSAVLRIDIAGALPDNHSLRSLLLSDAQYAALLAGITAELTARDPVLRAGFTPTDAFYPAHGRFHLLRTCNVWLGEKLRAAGVRFGLWTPLPLSVSVSHGLYH